MSDRLAPAIDEPADAGGVVVGPDWGPLTYLTLYRLIIAATLVAFQFANIAPRALGEADPALFAQSAASYLCFSAVAVVAARMRRPGFETQVVLQTFGDIAALTLLMHASGGVNSGFGMLMAVAIAGAAVLLQGRTAILFAAIATLAVLTEQIVSSLGRELPVGDYTHAGFLGLTFFTTAGLAHFAARRIRVSEVLAARRAVDVANLAQLNEHIIARMQSGILVLDSGLRIHRYNDAARELLGLETMDRGRPLSRVVPGIWALRARWLADEQRSTYSLKVDTTGRDVSVSFAALSQERTGEVLVYLEDAAALVQRAQALKLASLGRLTASIAHEIRNPLSAISHAGDLLGEADELAPPERRLTQIIRTNADRVDEIIESVMQLSRRAPSEPAVVRAAPWLDEFARDFRLEHGVEERLQVEPPPSDLELVFDAGQLRQVLWNLCENSLRHGGDDVRVTVAAGIQEDGPRPYLEARDDGRGLDEEAARHIFEPFFTTGANGTGLGLYIARELCEANRASLVLRPSTEGAVFRIVFPDPRRQPEAA